MLEEVKEVGCVAPKIAEFSRYVPGAKDFFQMKISESSMVQGLIGGNKLVASYGKFGERTGSDLSEFGELPPLHDRLVLEEKLERISMKVLKTAC